MRRMGSQKPERDARIVAYRAAGWSYQMIGAVFKITGPRVRQIVIREAKMLHRANKTEDAAAVLCKFAKVTKGNVAEVAQGGSAFSRIYRKAFLSTHPDQGGDPSDFMLVQAARDTLRRAQENAT